MPINTRPVSLLTTADRVEFFVRGEPFATYRYREGDTPGFTALYAQGERAVTQPSPNGCALWLMHGNVNGVAYGVAGETGGPPAGQIVTEDMTARRGALSVGFQHACAWLNKAGERALLDTRTVRVVPGPSEGTILDIEIRLQAPDDSAGHVRADRGFAAVRPGRVRALFRCALRNGRRAGTQQSGRVWRGIPARASGAVVRLRGRGARRDGRLHVFGASRQSLLSLPMGGAS